jgi:hypothetical protein
MHASGLLSEAEFLGLDGQLREDVYTSLHRLEGYLELVAEIGREFLKYGRIDNSKFTDQFESFFQDVPLASIVETKMRVALHEIEEFDQERAELIAPYVETYPAEFIDNLSVTYHKPLMQLMKSKKDTENNSNFLNATRALLSALILELKGGSFNNRTALIPVPGMQSGSLMKFWRANVLGLNQTQVAHFIEMWRKENWRKEFPNDPKMNPKDSDYREITQSMIQQFEIGRIKTPDLVKVFEKALGWNENWMESFTKCWPEPSEPSSATAGHVTQLAATQALAGYLPLPALSSLKSVREGRAGTVDKKADQRFRAHLQDVTLTIQVEDDAFSELPYHSIVTISMDLTHTPRDGMYLLGVQSPELGELSVTRLFKADMSSGDLQLRVSDAGEPVSFHSFDTEHALYRGTADKGGIGPNIRILGRVVGVYRELVGPGDY